MITMRALKAAREELVRVRAWTFSSSNADAQFDEYEEARDRLRNVARLAYLQGCLSTFDIREATGLTYDQAVLH
jgi:hypothetical protein